MYVITNKFLLLFPSQVIFLDDCLLRQLPEHLMGTIKMLGKMLLFKGKHLSSLKQHEATEKM